MEKVKIGVKYCGHCNPDVDGPSIVKAAQAVSDGLEFVPWDDDGKKVLLIVSACLNDCVSNPAFAGPVLRVAGGTLNGRKRTPEEMPGAIVMAIMDLLDEKQRERRRIVPAPEPFRK